MHTCIWICYSHCPSLRFYRNENIESLAKILPFYEAVILPVIGKVSKIQKKTFTSLKSAQQDGSKESKIISLAQFWNFVISEGDGKYILRQNKYFNRSVDKSLHMKIDKITVPVPKMRKQILCLNIGF